MCNLFVSQDARTHQPETRAMRLHGHSTSISLEAAFWTTLEEIAANEPLSLARFVAVLYDEIGERIGNVSNSTSFLRVTCLHYLPNQELHAQHVAGRLTQANVTRSDVLTPRSRGGVVAGYYFTKALNGRRPMMTPRRFTAASYFVLLGIGLSPSAHAQFPLPAQSAAPSAETLFRNQCGTCHTLSADEGPRQGPPLGGVVGRRAGSMPGFRYSAGLADAGFDWDPEHLDAWLTNPQVVIPGAVMAYRQANPVTRRTIIDWLKEQH